MSDGIVIIDHELLITMKREGKHYEANQLLKAYQQNLKQQRQQEKQALKRLEGKIRQWKLRREKRMARRVVC
jgi:hypothetical protein